VSGDLGSKGERRREQVLTEARRHLVDGGLERFSVRSVAEAVGITLGNLQYYFPTRDDLLAAVIRAEIAADASSVPPTGVGDAADELAAAVRTLSRRWSGESRSVYVALGLLAQQGSTMAELAAEVWSAAYDLMTEMVRAVSPSVPASEARARAMVIVALIDGASLQHFEARGRLSRRQVTEDVVRLAVAVARGGASLGQ
jgi:AcrR family transcriptional regulator